MAKKVAINGFGRIGRLTLRDLLKNKEVEVVAINDLTDNATLAHLFKYDSAQGQYAGEVSSDENFITIDGHRMNAYAERNPEDLPWGDLGVDVVLECTGVFRTAGKAGLHLNAGAKRVIISAPAKGGDVPFFVMGVNDNDFTTDHKIISNASCTTNCLAPVVKIVHENFGFVQGTMTTTHAYTSDQRIQDAPHSDLRRARAAAFNIVPTTTGAAKAVAKVFPAVAGKIDGMALRVPVITGSITELSCVIEKEATVEDVNAAFKAAAEGPMKGILQYGDTALVSSDIVGNKHSSIFDSQLTSSYGKFLKLFSWYDNEAGYAARMADLTVRMASML